MNILLEETKKGTWEISVTPTSPEEIKQGMPTSGEIALNLLGIARDLFAGVVQGQRAKPQGQVIQMPSASEIKNLSNPK